MPYFLAQQPDGQHPQQQQQQQQRQEKHRKIRKSRKAATYIMNSFWSVGQSLWTWEMPPYSMLKYKSVLSEIKFTLKG